MKELESNLKKCYYVQDMIYGALPHKFFPGVFVLTEEVRLAAKLAKIRLSEEELAAYTRAFEEAFASLSALNSTSASCEPLVHGIEGVSSLLREDAHHGDFGREKLFECAPDVQGDCYAVPKILE